MLHAMIMAGGGGTRFWPRSRAKRPKQFLTFSGDRTLLQSTVDRVVGADSAGADVGHHRRSLRGRDRGATARTAARPHRRRADRPRHRPVRRAGRRDHREGRPGRDHRRDAGRPRHRAGAGVPPRRPRGRAVRRATCPDALVTFGIRPTFPSTGYGYIHRGEPAGTRQGVTAARVAEFKEKPKFAAGRGVRRQRRVRLEQRHLRVEAGDHPGRTAARASRRFTPS